MLKTYLARGVSMQQGYGLTETSPMVSFLAPERALTKVGSSGRTPMFVEVKIVDSENRPVAAPSVQGEILVRGPNVFKGYWGQTGRDREGDRRRTVGSIPATPAFSTRRVSSPSAIASRT